MEAALKIEPEIGLVSNARFLTISDKQIVGGTLNGQTFYSAPVLEIDGDLIRTAEGSFRFTRNPSNA